jgi:hypothetical protein
MNIKLAQEDYTKIESILEKIAKDNNIEDVSEILVNMVKEGGVVKFAMGDFTDPEKKEKYLSLVTPALIEIGKVLDMLQNKGETHLADILQSSLRVLVEVLG